MLTFVEGVAKPVKFDMSKSCVLKMFYMHYIAIWYVMLLQFMGKINLWTLLCCICVHTPYWWGWQVHWLFIWLCLLYEHFYIIISFVQGWDLVTCSYILHIAVYNVSWYVSVVIDRCDQEYCNFLKFVFPAKDPVWNPDCHSKKLSSIWINH